MTANGVVVGADGAQNADLTGAFKHVDAEGAGEIKRFYRADKQHHHRDRDSCQIGMPLIARGADVALHIAADARGPAPTAAITPS